MSFGERRKALRLPTIEEIRLNRKMVTIFMFLRVHVDAGIDHFFEIRRYVATKRSKLKTGKEKSQDGCEKTL